MASAEDRETTGPAFSGRARRRTTSRSVHAANRIAGLVITLGGITTIAAVSSVCVFLVWVAVPLFLTPSTTSRGDFPAPAARAAGSQVLINEYVTMAWTLDPSGIVEVMRLDTGERIGELRPLGDRVPTAISAVDSAGLVAFGFSDGTIQYGYIAFQTRFLNDADVPEAVRSLEPGASAAMDAGMVERTSEGQYRLQTLTASLEAPVEIEKGSAIRLLDISSLSRGRVVGALTASNTLHVDEITTKTNLLTKKTTVSARGGKLKVDLASDEAKPAWLKISGLGDSVLLCWRDGRVLRYDTRNIDGPQFAETILITPESNTEVTALALLAGKNSLVAGDSRGRVRVWFSTRADGAKTPDGRVLSMAHELEAGPAAVTAIASSARSREIAVGYADGTVRLNHVTSERTLAQTRVADAAEPVSAVALSAKDDALVALSSARLRLWDIDAPHAEITPRAILTPVWYEGAPGPAQVWQSSSGTDDFEPKYGLYPLIFGTLKATVYSMLFGVPAALLAAIYTSEMLPRRARSRVKPAIEMMASLPSVVLGFLAALVVAPVIERVVPAALLAFAAVPFSILFGAHLWQLLPRRFATRHERFRIAFVFASIAAGLWIAIAAGPALERALFAGDMRAWLDGQAGGGTGGWMILLFPLASLVAVLVSGRVVSPWMLRSTGGWGEFRIALARMVNFLGWTACAAAGALAVSYLLAHGPLGLWSLDPRGSFVDTYVQRNAFIVGFIMGFAIIPIIYTISEDALSAVPDHLRTASLAAGATPWQTAIRIIIPTAASGLFSAVMIGFGRSVGETMIVLMAAGNTPVMDWNIFNGFRTLSANIAVELPEAVKDSTHYRMLFLAAFSLFAITFVLNTAAETVRQRFRKRAFQI